MSENSIRISIIQTDIVWENKHTNLRLLHKKLLSLCGTTEIVVLPEMFSTGFSMHSETYAEPNNGETLSLLQKWAQDFQLALCGSFMASDQEQYFNRAFFLTPDGKSYFYDKHHLFRMGSESKHFTAGSQKTLFSYRGWNIRLLVCYDLRFPVWSRNVNNEADLMIYMANWPASRRLAWDTLLRARAIENQCYVCGVNRIGTDGYRLSYNGGSALYSPLGETLAAAQDDQEEIITTSIEMDSLCLYRESFPVWKDADPFSLDETP